MPIYEFICKKCGHVFEVLCAMGKEKNFSCDSCGSKDLQKLISNFGIGGGSSRLRSSSPSCTSCSSRACSTCK